jgi:hypothetical protein
VALFVRFVARSFVLLVATVLNIVLVAPVIAAVGLAVVFFVKVLVD